MIKAAIAWNSNLASHTCTYRSDKLTRVTEIVIGIKYAFFFYALNFIQFMLFFWNDDTNLFRLVRVLFLEPFDFGMEIEGLLKALLFIFFVWTLHIINLFALSLFNIVKIFQLRKIFFSGNEINCLNPKFKQIRYGVSFVGMHSIIFKDLDKFW